MQRRAHAKVNLFLRVGEPLIMGDRAGYHPVRSWIHAIDLHDDITLERATHTRIEAVWESGERVDWDPQSDLTYKALRAMENQAGRALPTIIRIVKRIPDGAGLGGGSSNAASVLAGLSQIHDLSTPTNTRRRLASAIGADVAFFLDDERDPPRPALATGIGDELERLTPRDDAITLVIPSFRCSTQRVYDAYDALASIDKDLGDDTIDPSAPIPWDAMRNDLTDAARLVEPKLGALIDELRQHTRAPVLMSGSGSALILPGSPELPKIDGAKVIRTALV